MTSHPLIRLAPFAAAALLLVACQNETIVAGETPDDMAAQLNAAAPVELPPSISANKSYRCKDSSVVYVDWFSGDKQATVHPGKRDAGGTMLKADAAGTPKTAEGGWSLTGDEKSATITLAQPGKGSQSCKA